MWWEVLGWRVQAIETRDGVWDDIMKGLADQANYITKVSKSSFHGNDELKGSHCGVEESKQVFAF